MFFHTAGSVFSAALGTYTSPGFERDGCPAFFKERDTVGLMMSQLNAKFGWKYLCFATQGGRFDCGMNLSFCSEDNLAIFRARISRMRCFLASEMTFCLATHLATASLNCCCFLTSFCSISPGVGREAGRTGGGSFDKAFIIMSAMPRGRSR